MTTKTRFPSGLLAALKPVTVIVGHYGTGKTNFTVNLALDLRALGHEVTVVDLDIVNPYFRASEQRALLEARGVNLVAPVFAEAGTSLDVPSLRGSIAPAIEGAHEGSYVLVDVGGDDAGSVALGRFSQAIMKSDHAVLYVANRFRNLVADVDDALENLREIETASRLHITGIVNNSHLQDSTNTETVQAGEDYANELAKRASLPLICTTIPKNADVSGFPNAYRIERHVKTVWE